MDIKEIVKNLKIIEAPNPMLSMKCEPIEAWTHDYTLLADAMIDLMKDSNGVGLAAPQVGLPIRFFVAETDGHRICIANPEIVFRSEEKEWEDEGCLSFPDIKVPVLRSLQIELRGMIGDNSYSTFAPEGFMARVVQHEIDHLDGICHVNYLDRKHKRRLMSILKKKHKKNDRK
jgi:peptide deformylase